jgi:aspartokinase/homoserine dehydrogenase 1
MIVLKFGGTSVKDRAIMQEAARIVGQAHRRGRVAVVVSAMSGVTDGLIELSRMAVAGRAGEMRAAAARMARRHEAAARGLPGCGGPVREAFEQIRRRLEGIRILKECTPRSLDALISWGEVLESVIFAGVLARGGHRAVPLDTRGLVRTDDRFGDAVVDWPVTRENLRRALGRVPRATIPVITGFIGATADGEVTTLGRGGSDYTAALVGAAVGAREIQIWTDVDGIMSANPRQVPEAFPLPHVSYPEAMEMAYFGAKVIYPKTMIPAMEASIPIRIKNTMRPEAAGTRVTARVDVGEDNIRCVTSREGLSLINVEGGGMAGVPGIAGRLFGALARERISVILITQASSEQSICLIVEQAEAARARKAIEREFARERAAQVVSRIDVRHDLAIVAIVGDRMRGLPGIAGRLFGVLGKNRINIVAIAQGSSERNISFVVDRADVRKAVNVVHGVFRLSHRTINLFVIGVGVIGSELLRQIAAQREHFRRSLSLEVRVVGLADSRRWRFDPAGLRGASPAEGEPSPGIDGFMEALRGLENVIVVDASGSEEVARRTPDLLRGGYSVVTPNKLANTAPMKFYRRLMAAARERHSYYAYETTVGAGLPVISTMRDLLNSGDSIVEIQGILSGTLSFLFNTATPARPLSAVLREARERGFTEPDPRDDLSGRDFARKMLILAREMGLALELSDIELENLVPAALRRGSVAAFLRGMARFDDRIAARMDRAARRGRVLRYVGRVVGGRCRVGLQEVSPDSPLAQLRGTDNIILFRTRHYDPWPLVVRGPGAGAAVTAGGILADILKIAHLLAQV